MDSIASALKMVAVCLAFACLSQAKAAQRYVNPAHESASDSGNGTAAAPYKTLSHAMSRLQPGDHLVIAAGEYRDALVFPDRDWASADTLIEGQGRVLIKGSDVVREWKPLGGGRFVREWPRETAQVYLDGKLLSQIGGTLFDGYPDKPAHPLQALHRSQGGIWPGRKPGNEETMPVGSFYYNHERKSLFIHVPSSGGDPGGVEVSTRTHLMTGRNLDRLTIRNLAFSHGNTSPVLRGGLVSLIGNRIAIDRISVSLADSIGIHLAGDDITLSNSSANECGQLGINARGHRMRLVNNETSGNNTRGFNKWWEAGGAKFVGAGGLQDSTVIGHKAYANKGDGIWFDWKNHNNRIEKSIVAYNEGMGIQYEASTGAVITGNIVIGNAQRGIYLPHSSTSEISHNVIAGNGLEGIVVIDEGVRDPQGSVDFRPRANRVLGNVVAWNAAALYLPADIADNRSDSNFYFGTALQTRFSLGWPRKGSDRLVEWVDHSGQDRNSKLHETEVNGAFAKSISERWRQPDLDWIKAMPAGDILRLLPEGADQASSDAGRSSALTQ